MNQTNINIIIAIMMASSFIVLILETIGSKQNRTQIDEKTHIITFSIISILLSLTIAIADLLSQPLLSKNPQTYLDEISIIFILINSLIAIYFTQKTITNNQMDIFFLIISALTISIINISTDYLILKLIASTGWLIIIATLAIKTTPGGKKAEIGLKISFNAILVFLMLCFSLYAFTYSSHITDISTLTIAKTGNTSMGIFGLSLFFFSALCLAGIPPFSFAHIDCADGSNLSTAFLFLSGAIIQGGSHLKDAYAIVQRSNMLNEKFLNMIGLILAVGLLLSWLRALDQSKIKRTICYIATSIGPVFYLSLIFGSSELLPQLFFVITAFSFLTLSLFVLFGSLIYIKAIEQYWQTWEDISGIGRKNKIPALYLLIALACIAGLPGTMGYFVKLSVISPMQDNILFSAIIFISIAFGAACIMRIFVFLFSKQALRTENYKIEQHPPLSLMISALILIALGFFPFVR
ncbi:MAG: hypothetical protein KC505_07550 [Myxococcales bacterium]|nr:hypothetical protein [Myxococcales bacterium]USN51578.1 MAG: hypothetical protein H6731_03985 [Myxococcales bacterium]